MSQQHIETDYLVVGAGTAGLAFADTLIAESDAQVTIVDRRGKPGGHWNDAYPFVRLHQPSSFYGVNSMALGSGRIDTIGLNKGLGELASGAEVSAYFDRVMNHRLLPSGRVRYVPMSNYAGDEADVRHGRFVSLLSGAETQVTVRKKVVDATYFSPAIPSTHTPRFEVAAGVRLVAPNALPGLWHDAHRQTPARRFVVLGAGKTAMDTCVWLLQSGAPADSICWVMPRDSWLVNRVTTQNTPEFFHEAIGSRADQMEAFAKAASIGDLFLRLEACGALLRIDPNHTPSMFHLATLAPAEAQLLRRIENVVRLGRVQSIESGRMLLDRGEVAVEPGALFVDCTASAVEFRPSQPIFQGSRIVLQMVRNPQPAFSAAMTAYVEAHYADEADRNRLCGTVPFPNTPADYPRAIMGNMTNHFHWGQDKALREWIRASRLDGFGQLMAGADKEDAAKQTVLARLKEQSAAAMANMPRLLASAAAAQ